MKNLGQLAPGSHIGFLAAKTGKSRWAIYILTTNLIFFNQQMSGYFKIKKIDAVGARNRGVRVLLGMIISQNIDKSFKSVKDRISFRPSVSKIKF